MRSPFDRLMGWLGYSSNRDVTWAIDAAFWEGHAEGRAMNGSAAAERDGYKATAEQLERRLKVANTRLQAHGLHPVTGHIR